MDIHATKQRLDVKNSDVSGSIFDDVNMSGCTVHNINLSGLRIDYANWLVCTSITQTWPEHL